MLSIVFPHLFNKENDKVLELNLKMIRDNTTCPYEIIMVGSTRRPDLVYDGLDWGFRKAKYDLILWHSSDILLAPKWNEPVLRCKDIAKWISLEMIECGQIGVYWTHMTRDFGLTADTFNRKEFEDFIEEYAHDRADYREEFGWYSPSVIHKDFYIENGGFKTEKPFPNPNDEEFKYRVRNKTKFIIVNGWSYHFQRGHINVGDNPER